MRFFSGVILIAILSAAAEFFLPWWTCALVCFLVALLIRQGAGRAFLMGFCGVGLLWLIAALLHDLANAHILSSRMALLFKLPNYGLFIVVTVFVGALIGGLAASAGALLKPRAIPQN
jgi:hypothetical protein